MLIGKKIGIIITGDIPTPSEGASIILFYYYLKAIVDANANVYCLCIVQPGTLNEQKIKKLEELLPNLILDVQESKAILFDIYISIHDRTNGKCPDTLKGLIGFAPEGLLCFDLQAAAFGRFVPAKVKTVWLGDLQFHTLWFHFLYTLKERLMSIKQLPYTLLGVRGWRRQYKKVLSHFSNIIVSSYSSVAVLKKMGILSNYAPYPWPALVPSVQQRSEKPKFLFFGSLLGLGSRSALHMLLDKIYPLLIRNWGNDGFCIRIAGRSTMNPKTQMQIASCPEIASLGFVDDLSEEIARCHAVLAPMDVPVGNRSRILTALSAGAVLIAHKNVTLGNPDLVSGVNCLLASDAESFVEAMKHSVNEHSTMEQIANNGRKMYADKFSVESAAPLFANFFRSYFSHS